MVELGPGVSTYHQYLVMILSLFLFLTILHIPVMVYFRSFGYFDDDSGFILQHSLANMGFSKTRCNIVPVLHGKEESISCKAGVISEVVDWGIKTKIEDRELCVRKDDD